MAYQRYDAAQRVPDQDGRFSNNLIDKIDDLLSPAFVAVCNIRLVAEAKAEQILVGM